MSSADVADRGRPPLQAVLFDYGHTLIYFDEHPHAALIDAYGRINHLLRNVLAREVPAAEDLIRNVSLAVDSEIRRDYASGREEEIEIAGLYDTCLRRIGLELEPTVIEQVMELEQAGWLNSVHVGPDVPDALQAVRRAGLRVGLVSNAAYRPRLMHRQLEALRLADYFDGLTFSSEVGLRKPHPAIYKDALHKLAVPAEATLFVGDRLREDVRGPQAIGMRAVLLGEWRHEEDPAQEADYHISRIAELRGVLTSLKAIPGDTYN